MAELSDLTARLREFRDAREWQQFHTPGNLAAALAVEAAELQALFLWSNPQEQRDVVRDRLDDVEAEVADVLISALNLALAAGIDPEQAVRGKIARNEERYPVELARGNAKKYSEL